MGTVQYLEEVQNIKLIGLISGFNTHKPEDN